MKLPKTVQICGKTYKVNRSPNEWGGSCETGAQVVTIGTAKNQSAHRISVNFVHEVLEAVALEQFKIRGF